MIGAGRMHRHYKIPTQLQNAMLQRIKNEKRQNNCCDQRFGHLQDGDETQELPVTEAIEAIRLGKCKSARHLISSTKP